MDFTIEKYFVNTFIRKKYRERLLYEFTNEKKRYDGLSRFCHQTKQLIELSKIIMEGSDIDRSKEFLEFVRKHDEICLILSPDINIDEQFISLKEAIPLASMCLDAVIILGSCFAVVYSEPMKGGREKYLLLEK